jgi:hypothetical protein
MSSNYLFVSDFRSPLPRRSDLYRYNLNNNDIQHLHTFTSNITSVGPPFNGIIIDNALTKETSTFYTLFDDQVVIIGDKTDRHREVYSTFFYPEKNKMVQVAGSGIWVYDIEYTVSETDQVVVRTERSELMNIYPNPFNPESTIMFSIQNVGNVIINVYNLRGQRVKALVNGYKQDGEHSIVWNGRDDNGRELGSGIYFIRMVAGEDVSVRRVVLLR